MILFYDKQTAIITPPKTASTTLLHSLCNHPYYGIFCIGPSGPKENFYIDHHSVICPQAGFIWKKIAIVRHPLQRLVSLWGHLAKEQLMNLKKPISIDEFVDVISNNKHPFYFYQWNLNKILVDNDYQIVHIENLQIELLELDIINYKTELPTRNSFNTSSSPDYQKVLTDEHINKLRWWWEPDATRFGYSVGG